jgi:hypothetical protein
VKSDEAKHSMQSSHKDVGKQEEEMPFVRSLQRTVYYKKFEPHLSRVLKTDEK